MGSTSAPTAANYFLQELSPTGNDHKNENDRVASPTTQLHWTLLPSNLQKSACSLIHCILVDSSTVICWTSPFVVLWVSFLSLLFYFSWKTLLASIVDPDQMSHYVASDLGLHCLTMTWKEWDMGICFQQTRTHDPNS